MRRTCSTDLISGLLPLALATSGCGLIEPSAPDAATDRPRHDASVGATQDAAPAWDAGALATNDDAGSFTDANVVTDANESCDDGPCESPEAGARACTSDAQCAPSEYCSRVSAHCSARCDARNGCVGPTVAASNNRIATNGVQICYADDDAVMGGPEYVIRAWDGEAPEPRTIGRGANARVLLAADGYCYFSAPSLERAPLSGGATERVQTLQSAPRRAWLSSDYVWWSAPRAELLDVYRLRRTPDASAELVASVPSTSLWEGGNDTHLFRRFKPTFASCAIVMAPIEDLSAEITIPMSFSKNCSGAFWASEESILFTQFEPVHYYPFRVDLANLGTETTIRLHSQELLMYQVRGAWVYAQSVVDGASVVGVPNTVSYQRARLNGDPTERLFTPTPGTASYTVSPFELDDNVYRTFAILDGRIVYQHKSEFRLIVAPLAAPE